MRSGADTPRTARPFASTCFSAAHRNRRAAVFRASGPMTRSPVFYVQYGHARTANVFVRAAEQGIPVPEFDLEVARLLVLPQEQDLLRRIAAFPDLVAGAALANEPHRVAFWLQETIAVYHSYYTLGKKSAGSRILAADPRITAARLFLCRALKQVLANGLAILGVSAPDRLESPETREEGEDA